MVAVKVAVTGATGFVGSALRRELHAMGHDVVPVVRRAAGLPGELVTGALEDADVAVLAHGLRGVDAVAHLAALTHVPRGTDVDAFRRVNVDGTARLLAAIAQAGAGRLVLMSSIKVNGEETWGGRRFSGSDTPAPEDAYGRTKLAAERLVAQAGRESGLETVILRPPMVYGAEVGGNFARLVAAVRRGIPLPLGRVDNRRSLISVDNLAAATVAALTRPGLKDATLTIGDGEDVSTRTLVEAIGAAIGRRPRLLPVPVPALLLAGRALGRGAEIRRLVGDLQVDAAQARAVLDWAPRERLSAALSRMLGPGRPA